MPVRDGSSNCVLRLGNYDNVAVIALQFSLANCNGAWQPWPPDGDYGPITRDVVLWTQAANGIAADGVYGPQTRRAMRWLRDADNQCIYVK